NRIRLSLVRSDKFIREGDEYIKCILSGYLPVVDRAEVTGDDAKFEFVMLALRTAAGISASAYKSQFGTDWKKDFAKAYQKTSGYLEEDGDRTRIKDEYLYVQNGILTEYME
ncbi:MAG: hypothetical protein K2H43_02500, partial [Clostridia bacterium]|nr:hypothetical protein [Clostridia bacterium]